MYGLDLFFVVFSRTSQQVGEEHGEGQKAVRDQVIGRKLRPNPWKQHNGELWSILARNVASVGVMCSWPSGRVVLWSNSAVS